MVSLKKSGGYAPGLKHHELPNGFIASRFEKNQKLAIFTLTYNDYTNNKNLSDSLSCVLGTPVFQNVSGA